MESVRGDFFLEEYFLQEYVNMMCSFLEKSFEKVEVYIEKSLEKVVGHQKSPLKNMNFKVYV